MATGVKGVNRKEKIKSLGTERSSRKQTPKNEITLVGMGEDEPFF